MDAVVPIFLSLGALCLGAVFAFEAIDLWRGVR